MRQKVIFNKKSRICCIILFTISLILSIWSLFNNYIYGLGFLGHWSSIDTTLMFIPSLMMLIYNIMLYKSKHRNIFVYTTIAINISLIIISNAPSVLFSMGTILFDNYLTANIIVGLIMNIMPLLIWGIITCFYIKSNQRNILIIKTVLTIYIALLAAALSYYLIVLRITTVELYQDICYYVALLLILPFVFNTKQTKNSKLTDELSRLKRQHESGKITEEEYTRKKNNILDSISYKQ